MQSFDGRRARQVEFGARFNRTSSPYLYSCPSVPVKVFFDVLLLLTRFLPKHPCAAARVWVQISSRSWASSSD